MDIKDAQKKLDSFLDDRVSDIDLNIKLAIGAGLIIVPLICFYLFFYSPKQKEITQLKAQSVALQVKIKKVEDNIQSINKLRAEMAEAQVMFEKASSLLPQKQEIPALLANISDLCRNSGLVISIFKPGSESPSQFYAQIPIGIKVTGPYHNIGVFLDKVSKMSRIVSVLDLTIGSPKKDSGEMILGSQINLVTYRFVKDAAANGAKD